MKKTITFLIVSNAFLTAQNINDTIKKIINLQEIEINEKNPRNQIYRLPAIENTYIHAAKKNDVINLASTDADLSNNNTRQIFAKVAGINIWENDGSGIQIGVATRGLSPNRSWEFNVRQNTYDISSEVFGYPEAYFNPPMEAVEKIQLIRGAASLQYGPQFGGLLNYQIKKASKNKPIEIESQQTYGSYNLFNSYNAIGGTTRKFSYYAYLHHRTADGWRQNSKYQTTTGYFTINYAVTEKLNVGIEYTKMNYLSQQPGGLTDSLFNINPRISLRARNWFNVPWNVYAMNVDYNFSENTKLNIKIFGLIAERNSVGFTKNITISDTFNTTIGSYNPRQVDRDAYKNIGTEVRFLHGYNLFKHKHHIAAGLRAYKGYTLRRQLGIGSGNSDFDVNIYQLQNEKEWGRALNLYTNNYAVFVENIFNIGPRLSIVPGIRYEIIYSSVNGFINTSSAGNINLKRNRNILLAGVGTEFKVSSTTNLYSNYSQAYRPILFSELTPPATNAVIDPNLKDANGYNIDVGYRGSVKNLLTFDISYFYLYYNNRIGTFTQNSVPYRTNIGTSISKGIEAFAEIDLISAFVSKSKIGYITLFASYTYMDSRYARWDDPTINNNSSKTIQNKKVEYAPEQISRYGINYHYKGFSLTVQVSQTSDVYADATNTNNPSKDATTGKIKGYTITDINSSYILHRKYTIIIKTGINNLLDEKYATRRSSGYPGPGLLPGNGRSFYITLGLKI